MKKGTTPLFVLELDGFNSWKPECPESKKGCSLLWTVRMTRQDEDETGLGMRT